jgi:23S rRNA (adenine2030-N6)-methyltransferase
LETFDALLRELERLALPPTLAAQVRLRPLTNPMRMNGCAMIVAGCPQVEAEARDACEWVARALGEAGAAARVERIGG